MLERTTNVLLKEIEEPSPHTIWLLCAPSAQDVLPTIRSRTRIVNLAVPSNQAVAKFLESQGFEPNIAARAARLSEGHIGIASLYAKDERVMTDRDELIVGVLGLHRASDAVLLAGNLIDNAKAQAEAEVNVKASEAEADFRRINGLGPKDRIPPKLRGAYNAIAKKDELKRRATRLTRDVLDRALNSVASIYRDVAVLQNNAEERGGAHQPRKPFRHHGIVGTARPYGGRAPAGGHRHRAPQAQRQRQSGFGVRSAVLRADSVIFVISSNYRRFDSRFTGGTPRNPAQ